MSCSNPALERKPLAPLCSENKPISASQSLKIEASERQSDIAAQSETWAQHEVVKESYLMKMKGNCKPLSSSKWNKRFFQLRGLFLLYYRRQNDATTAGWLRIDQIRRLEVLNSDIIEGTNRKADHCFRISLSNRVLVLRAKNAEERDEWVDALKTQRTELVRPPHEPQTEALHPPATSTPQKMRPPNTPPTKTLNRSSKAKPSARAQKLTEFTPATSLTTAETPILSQIHVPGSVKASHRPHIVIHTSESLAAVDAERLEVVEEAAVQPSEPELHQKPDTMNSDSEMKIEEDPALCTTTLSKRIQEHGSESYEWTRVWCESSQAFYHVHGLSEEATWELPVVAQAHEAQWLRCWDYDNHCSFQYNTYTQQEVYEYASTGEVPDSGLAEVGEIEGEAKSLHTHHSIENQQHESQSERYHGLTAEVWADPDNALAWVECIHNETDETYFVHVATGTWQYERPTKPVHSLPYVIVKYGSEDYKWLWCYTHGRDYDAGEGELALSDHEWLWRAAAAPLSPAKTACSVSHFAFGIA